ncbi:MAG: SRPBCC family protein [Acidimicrobiia bacterium]|nr:SRPBCC family protein [Acidimicrobiia bacterium]
MAHIADRLLIEAPIEEVFDTVADSRNEPSFNPSMTSVELLTPEPIGLGTRFRALMGRQQMEMLVELTEYERPFRLGSHTVSSMMETSGTITFTTDGESTVMAWDWRVRARGWFRALSPLVGPLGRRMERRIWTRLKQMLERDQPSAGHGGSPGRS